MFNPTDGSFVKSTYTTILFPSVSYASEMCGLFLYHFIRRSLFAFSRFQRISSETSKHFSQDFIDLYRLHAGVIGKSLTTNYCIAIHCTMLMHMSLTI